MSFSKTQSLPRPQTADIIYQPPASGETPWAEQLPSAMKALVRAQAELAAMSGAMGALQGMRAEADQRAATVEAPWSGSGCQ